MLSSARQYSFSGAPVSQALALGAHRADRAAESQLGSARLAAEGQFLSELVRSGGAGAGAQQRALGDIGAAQAGAYGQIGAAQAQAGANRYGAYATGMSNLGNSYAQHYGAYNSALQNLYSNQQAASAQAEAARQVGLANLGSAAMSAGGQASAAAMGAWAGNQAAFARAMADANVANQNAITQYGVGRDASLAALGSSAASLGGSLGNSFTNYQQNANNFRRDMSKLDVARELGLSQAEVSNRLASNLPAAMGGLGQAMGGLAMTANGQPLGGAGGSSGTLPAPSVPGGTPYSPIPSYRGGSSYGSAEGPGDTAALEGLYESGREAFGSINESRRSINESPILDALMRGSQAGRDQLDSAYYSSRSQPSQMLQQSLGSFNDTLRFGARNMNSGMHQFYGSLRNDAPARMREAMIMGNRSLGRVGSAMQSGYREQPMFQPQPGMGVSLPSIAATDTSSPYADILKGLLGGRGANGGGASDAQALQAMRSGVISPAEYNNIRRRNLGL